jgi:hypothetical protein
MLHFFDLHFHFNAAVPFVAFCEQCEASVVDQGIFLFTDYVTHKHYQKKGVLV